MKAYYINSEKREITALDHSGRADIRRSIGGSLALAHMWNNGDTLYVDDEGLLKSPRYGFKLLDGRQPFGGNGVLVGAEIGGTANTSNPTITLAQLCALVLFIEFASWDS